MKKILFTLLTFNLFTALLFAGESNFQMFGVGFGISEDVVREKLKDHFHLPKVSKYHRYLIGENEYRILFSYEGDREYLSEIKIYGKHFPLKKFRVFSKIAWKDLDDFAISLLGDGFGTRPHLLTIQKGVDNSDKDWKREGVQADLGIQKDDLGFFVQLTITEGNQRSAPNGTSLRGFYNLLRDSSLRSE